MSTLVNFNQQKLITGPTKGTSVSFEDRAATVKKFDGYWLAKETPTIEGVVVDERKGLGTNRPPVPRTALDFNGVDQYGWIAIDPVTEFPFTLFGWFNLDVVEVNRALFSVSASPGGTASYALELRNDGFNVIISGSNVGQYNGGAMPSNEWISLMWVVESDVLSRFYRNGVYLGDAATNAFTLPGTYENFVVGSRRRHIPTSYLDGKAQHCGFLRRAATLQDAIDFHNTGIIEDAEVLLPLDDNSSTVAHNIGISAYAPQTISDLDWSIEEI